jgi:diguanylate cyclase (GGDEF)-like protein
VRLAEDSRRDPLTGLLNRRALADDLDPNELRGSGSDSLAVALCDVDRFKAYNDRLGHLAGDRALRALAATVLRELRITDSAYRFGGEELLLVLRSGTADAIAIAERVRSAVAEMSLPHPDGVGGILTVSIGIAAGSSDPSELLAAADAALYQAKAAGRDRVVAASEDRRAQPARAPRHRATRQPAVQHAQND